jgi:putative ABC transport system permease protein
MSIWTRMANVFRRERIGREIDEEFRLHIEEAIEAGRDPQEVRRAFGPLLRTKEQSRDLKISSWLDSLRADFVFGWRMLWKNKTASGVAILSLALTIGACTSAFRLVDAILLRPMPVAAPERLFTLSYQYLDQNQKKDIGDSFEYPLFRRLREGVADQAEVMAISYSSRIDITYGSAQEVEKAHRQYVSGWTLSALGLRPRLGRLLTASDDLTPGGHPYAVLSHDYWRRRFGADPKIVGRKFQAGKESYEIVGVLEEGFTGTETGTMTDLFIPTMMFSKAIDNWGWTWFRTWVQVKPGVEPEQVRQRLLSVFSNARRERTKSWKGVPQDRVDQYIQSPLYLDKAAAGASGLQKRYKQSLLILSVLVSLLLLIACANVANLMMAQAAVRAKEMALRISIGAGRWRLVQLVLSESALVALIATVLGGFLAWWSAPFVVSMISPPDNPARLVLPADGRVLAFAASLTTLVVFLFGLAPAWQASTVQPMLTIRGGANPHGRKRLMNGLVAAQVAFCFLVHFVAGLFLASFDRLTHQATGFSSERLLALEVVAGTERSYADWEALTAKLKNIPGVEQVAMSGWSLMNGNRWTSGVRVNGTKRDQSSPYFLSVSPGWLATMRIQQLEGRDFRSQDIHPKVAIVNQAFARRYFPGQSPVGKSFDDGDSEKPTKTEIIGLVADAKYADMRDAIRPTVYVPQQELTKSGELKKHDWMAFAVKVTTANPLSMAPTLQREIAANSPGFRVAQSNSQQQLVDSHTIRERMLAMLSVFFAGVALVLAGVGLYGVLSYSVLQRRREIGIRMALGAMPGEVAQRVMFEVLVMLALGSALGIAAGLASERYLIDLLYQVKASDWSMISLPILTLATAAILAGLAPVLQAVRTDPANVLRAE